MEQKIKFDSSKPLEILIVEDELVNSKLLEAMLSKSPLGVSKVKSAQTLDAALALLAERHFDVVLLDLNLPDSTGLDTLTAISGQYPLVAIVVITGEYGDDTGLEAISSGAQEYLVKGKYDAYTLSKSIYYAIERKRAEQVQAQLLKEVESVNHELKSFAYIVSHDLKAPLRGIRTLTDWILADHGDKLGNDGREQITLLSGRVDRMHNLIEAILQYSRVGRIKEEKVRVNLSELVPEIIDLISPPENIAITIENELPKVLCEQTRIQQVFQNLLSNAVKYMDKVQGRIAIGCVEEGDCWKFSVSDNGSGIEEKYFKKIFEIFQTLSPRDEYESTGVGLTVVKKIVELYGGRIWVESEHGHGSTFFFTLPSREMRAVDAKLQVNTVS